MTIEVETPGTSLGETVAGEFRVLATNLAQLFDHLAEQAGIPTVAVTAILAADFRLEVESRHTDGAGYDPARLGGGQVVAKTIPHGEDAARSDIIIDESYWGPTEDRLVQARRIGILAHEFAHTLLNRAGASAAGRRNHPRRPTTDDIAFEIGSAIADEYRADRLAEIAVGVMVTTENGDEVLPFRTWDFFGEQYVTHVATILGAIGRDCSKIVDEGASGSVEPALAWMGVASIVQDALISVMHAQAFADNAGVSPDVLARPEIAELPSAHYFSGPVSAFLGRLRNLPALVALADTAAVDKALEEAGAQMIHDILEPIGLRTIRSHAEGRIVVGHMA
jgi:hypothetical protein